MNSAVTLPIGRFAAGLLFAVGRGRRPSFKWQHLRIGAVFRSQRKANPAAVPAALLYTHAKQGIFKRRVAMILIWTVVIPPLSRRKLIPSGQRHDRLGWRGFTLVELLVVMSIISLLFALTVPSMGLLNAKNLTNSGNELFDVATMARQNAISKNAYTAILIKSSGIGAFSSYTILELTRKDDGHYGTWKTLTPWRYLPNGIVFSAESFSSSANFLNVPSAPPVPWPSSCFQGQQIDLTSATVFQIYQPDGTLSVGQNLRLRLVEGTSNPDGSITFTHRTSDGRPANYYDLVFLRDSGQTKAERL